MRNRTAFLGQHGDSARRGLIQQNLYMQPPNHYASTTEATKETANIARAVQRWHKWTHRLSNVDKALLNEMAADVSLKSACRRLEVNYDTSQKRLKRLQDVLNLRTLHCLLFVWRVAGPGTMSRNADEPTILRHAASVVAVAHAVAIGSSGAHPSRWPEGALAQGENSPSVATKTNWGD